MPETGAPAHTRHRLAWLDQLAYELFRLTGRSQRIQCLWHYDRDVDLAALGRTNERLTALPVTRLIEPSSLPLGRPSWVRPSGAPVPIQSGSDMLARSELLTWANRQARLTIDPVNGPAWRMAVQRFDDGSTLVSIVASHLVIDGMGAMLSIEAAVNGTDVPNPYRVRGGRGLLAMRMSDAWQVVADAPRTVAALARIGKARWRTPTAAAAPPVVLPGEEHRDRTEEMELPALVVTIDAQVWDACAQRLGGPASTLLPGFVASLASNLGRSRPSDGAISLVVPVNRRRGLGDERALAIDFQKMIVAPKGLAKSLRPLHALMKAMLRGTKEEQADGLAPLLPAVAWMPRTVATAIVNRLFTYADELPVSCSNIGKLPEGLGRIDGAPCARVLTRAVDVNVTRRDLERSHGHLVVVGSRYGKTVSLGIEACQLAPTPTTTDELRLATSRTLADFGLDAVIET